MGIGKLNLCQIHLPLTIHIRMTISYTPFSRCVHGVSNQWVSGRSGIYVVKTSTTRATPVVEDTVFWTSTPLLDTLYHCTSAMQSYKTDTTIVVFP